VLPARAGPSGTIICTRCRYKRISSSPPKKRPPLGGLLLFDLRLVAYFADGLDCEKCFGIFLTDKSIRHLSGGRV
jgi:hypothetical protein